MEEKGQREKYLFKWRWELPLLFGKQPRAGHYYRAS